MGKIIDFFKNIYEKIADKFAKLYTKFENFLFWKDKKSEELKKKKKDIENAKSTGEVSDSYILDPKKKKLNELREIINERFTVIKQSKEKKNIRTEFKKFFEEYSEFLDFQFPYSSKCFKFRAFEMWGVFIPRSIGFRKLWRTGIKMEDYITWEEREELWARGLREGKIEYNKFENGSYAVGNLFKRFSNLFRASGQQIDVSKFKTWTPILSPVEYNHIFEETFDYENPTILNKKEKEVVLSQKEEQKNNETRTNRNK